MGTDKSTLGFAYLRLSNEEAQGGESSSITDQRMIVQNYCKQNNITLVWEFSDDGRSGGNFDRPAFQDVKSKKKVPVPRDDWAVTEDTHPPLVTKQLYERVHRLQVHRGAGPGAGAGAAPVGGRIGHVIRRRALS